MKNILIGEKYAEKLRESLIFSGFTPVFLPENPNLDKRLSSHADLSVILLESKKLVLAKHLAENRELVNLFTSHGFIIIEAESQQKESYPYDAGLCACKVGNILIHNEKCIDPAIIKCTNLKFVNVRQGYSKCSVCVVDDNSIITSDKGIARAAKQEQIEVLEINDGEIELDGFDKGFIGGAGFSCEGTIYFTGRIDKHSDYNQIKWFIESRGKQIRMLTDEPLFDIGGAIIL